MSDFDTTARWDEAYHSGNYRQRWHYSHPSPELVALIAGGVVPAGARVLDVGCGAGTESIFLARSGFRTLGIDFSEGAIAIARRTAQRVAETSRPASASGDPDSSASELTIEFRVADITALDVAEGAFHFANDRGVFHLFDRAGRAAYAAAVGRALAPGGALAIRGARVDGTGDQQFKALTVESIDEHFPAARFSRGPFVPIEMLSDNGSLLAHMVVVRKRWRPVREDGGVQVQGLGGVFFKASDPKALQAWYERHLGLPADANGYINFRWRPVHEPATTAQTVWSAFQRDTQYFAPSEAGHMLNYRVADLDAALARLRADGVQVMDQVEDGEYGKFGWCLDPEGNKIELWQPPA